MNFHDRPTRIVSRAKVVDNKDPDKLGRVKVTYPDSGGDSTDLPSQWARLCRSYSSGQHGEWSLPEIGDEVLVLFEGPDVNHPIVVGSLYGITNKPPASGKPGDHNADGNNSLRFIKTKSGNLLAFSDAAGEEGIQVKDKAGAQLNLKKGKVALGTASAELFDLLEKLLDTIAQNEAIMVSTAVGPGKLNAAILQKVNDTKSKIAEMKGTLD
jgi:uncharacterized protein involved in type VI secretion and phage assembly